MHSQEEQLGIREDLLFETLDESEIPPSDIVSFTELRSASDLVRMYQEAQLIIEPEFQREVVWSNSDQTRFIDSMIKQLPIPSMCFSLDYKTQTWQVIDGLQRISTILKFLTDKNWKLSNLDDIDKKIAGKNTKDFSDNNTELLKLRRIVENASLPINVLRCDYSKKDHRDYIFEIFHRLNTGGRALSNQEVRNCIYNGALNTLLNRLNENKEWLYISKLHTSTGKRYRGQEIILRLFAFADEYENYNGKLARFLNDYMDTNQNPSEQMISDLENQFQRVVSVVNRSLGDKARSKSLTLFEAFLVGCWRNIDSVELMSIEEIKSRFDDLANSPEFSTEALSEGLSAKDKVRIRMNKSESLLSNV